MSPIYLITVWLGALASGSNMTTNQAFLPFTTEQECEHHINIQAAKAVDYLNRNPALRGPGPVRYEIIDQAFHVVFSGPSYGIRYAASPHPVVLLYCESHHGFPADLVAELQASP